MKESYRKDVKEEKRIREGGQDKEVEVLGAGKRGRWMEEVEEGVESGR